MSATIQTEPATAAHRSSLLGWGTVRAGLGVSFFGTLLSILCPILLFVVSWTLQGQQVADASTLDAGLRRGQQMPTVLQAVALVCCLLGWISGGVLFIAGACMGAAAPPGSGARGWSFGACILGPLSVVMLVLVGLIFSVEVVRSGLETEKALRDASQALQADAAKSKLPPLPDPVFGPGETKIIVLGFEGVCLLTLLCHLLSLRAVASSFHRSSLSLAVACFMLSSILWVAGVNFVGLREEQLTTKTLELLGMLIVGGLAVLQLWYLALAVMVRRAIGEGLSPG